MNMDVTYYRRALAAALLCGLLLSGCSGGEAQAADTTISEVSIREAVTEADPEEAVQAVYDAFPDTIAEDMTSSEYRKQFTDVTDAIEEYYGRISSPNNGLGDLLILKPIGDSHDRVRESLHQYQERRVREFENYDILDAHTIAREAVIYDQGDYVILVMFADNQAVRDIIDDYIPM